MNLKRNGKSPSAAKYRRRASAIRSQCDLLEQRTLLSLAFGNSVTTNVFNLYRGAQVANINGDADEDVVVGTRTGNSGGLTGTAVLISNGDGTFTPTSTPPVMPSSSGTVNPFIVGTFTQDSQADILYLTESNSGGASNGDLIITPEINNDDSPVTFTAGTVTDVPPAAGTSFDPIAVVAGHFTDDGNMDLAVLGNIFGGQELVILEGNDTGTFEPIAQAPFTFPSDGFNGGDELVTGNFTGSGNVDIAVYDSTTGSLDIIENEGTSTFQQMTPVMLTPSNYTIDGATIAAADFTGTGVTDLVVSDNIGTDDNIDVYLDVQGTGTFLAPLSFNDGNPDPGVDFNGSIATGDFNNDSFTDVADDFGVLLGDGTGSLAAPVPGLALGSGTGTEFATIVPGDFDGNGIPDLAGISLTGNGFEAALNTTPQTTSTTVLSSEDTSPLGTAVTFTATVSSSSTDGTPTGTVTFLDGTTDIGSGDVVSSGGEDTATFTTSALTSGVHSITADYSGDASFAASTSSPISQTITETTTTTLAASSSTVNSGAIATFTATVAPTTPGGAVPTGTVSFLQDGNDLGDVTLNGTGVATFGTASLSAGQDIITASYSGDDAYAASTSNTVTETINARSSTAANLVPTIATAKLPAQGVIGGKIKAAVPVVITNQGQTLVKGKITLNVYVSTLTTLDSTATLLFSQPRNASVAAGKAETIPLTITSLPKTLSSGTYYVLVQVLDPSGFGNTAASSSTMQLAAPFISYSSDFTGLNLPDTVIGGTKSKAVASLQIDNFGNVASVGVTTIQLFTSSDLNLDSGDAQIASQKFNLNIGSDKFHVVKIPLKAIPNVASGDYYILGQVTDPDGNVTQAATLGTVQIDAATVTLSTSITSVSPGTIKIGSVGTMVVTITNNGNTASSGALTIDLGVSSDGFTQAATLVTLTQKTVVKANLTVVLHLKFKVPTTQAAGTFDPTVTITDAAGNSSGLIVGLTPLILSS